MTATSVVRLAYIVTIDYHNDFSFHSVPSTFLAVLEPPETILCVSLPMIYSFLARVWPSKGPSTPRLGGPQSHTYSSSFARRDDPHKRSFTPLQTALPDPFELSEIHGTQRRVMVSVEKKCKGHRALGSRLKSIDRDGESSGGSEVALAESVPKASTEKGGGIMVSKDFTVSVSHE